MSGFICIYFGEIHGFPVNSSGGGGVRQLSSSFDTKHIILDHVRTFQVQDMI